MRKKKAIKKKVAKKRVVTKIIIKKKPTKKRMSNKDLYNFKKLILDKKEKLLDQIRRISEDTLRRSQKESSGDVSGYTLHMADVATDTYDREFSLELASNDRQLLYEIDDALKRIEEGTFGVCEECDKFIAKTRLKAIPYTRLCLKCQKKFEKK